MQAGVPRLSPESTYLSPSSSVRLSPLGPSAVPAPRLRSFRLLLVATDASRMVV